MPTYEELEATIERFLARIESLESKIAHYEAVIASRDARIEDLEGQLKRNSKNSSKPPSSDQKSNLPRVEKKETRPFHSGASRQLVEESLVISQTDRSIDTCPRCRFPMTPTGEVTKWQQIELPEVKPLVHQWNLHTCHCP